MVGFALAGVAGGAIALMATGGQAEPLFMAIQDSMLLRPVAKFAVAFPLTFHLLGGVRHLAWDNIWGHEQETVTSTAWGLLYGSLGISALLTLVQFEE